MRYAKNIAMTSTRTTRPRPESSRALAAAATRIRVNRYTCRDPCLWAPQRLPDVPLFQNEQAMG
jgi:hypothetical protein